MLIVYSYTVIILYKLVDTIRYSCLYNIPIIYPSIYHELNHGRQVYDLKLSF